MSTINTAEKALHASNSYISLCVFIGKIISVLKMLFSDNPFTEL